MTEQPAWSGEDVRLTDVLDALGDLRRSTERAATRTAVMTLIVVAADAAAARLAAEVVHRLGGRHPARTVVIVTESSGPQDRATLDARVALHGSRADGTQLWSEDVVITARGGALRHLDSLVEPLALPDLPVVVWYVRSAPAVADPLVAVADAILVDTRAIGAQDCFAAVLELARHTTVIDLSWVRLTPWRLLLAGLFEGRDFRPFVREIGTAAVRGKPGPRHLLAGWLSDRLGLSRQHLHIEDARHVAIRLQGRAGGAEGDFRVERGEGERLVRSSAAVSGGPSHEEVLALPDESLPWSLAEALTNLEPDPVYEGALHAALDLP